MAWRSEKTDSGKDLVWEGVEQGIAPSPTKGTANIQNANISTEMGEVMASYGRLAQTFGQAQITNGTLTASAPVGATFLATSAALEVGQWINVSASNISLTSASVQYGVIAGGGGGGGNSGGNVAGGGGAGGVTQGTLTLGITSYAITIGAGGAGGANTGAPGTSGNDSSIAALVVTKGGGGGGGSSDSGLNGGSGGGEGNSGADPGSGITGQGFAGGQSATGGGGGGGASAVGGNASTTSGGAGGAGIVVNLPAGGGTYGGGGGGGADSGGTEGAGGTGGGGTGGTGAGVAATAGAVNTGGGGGGAGNATQAGAAGGSGKVVIVYPTGTVTATGGTITTSGGYTIHTFNSNGTFQITAIPLPTGYYFISSVNGSGNVTLSRGFDPSASYVLTHGTSGTATFSTTHRSLTTAIIAKAKEKYQTETTTEYRYYMLDTDGYVWVYDTMATSLRWMLTDPTDYSSYDFTGMEILNGWLLVLNNINIYGKPTVNLGPTFELLDNADLNNPFPTHTNFAYTGHQGKMFYCDGNYLGELFPTTSLVTSVANVQSYAAYSSSAISLTATAVILAGAGAATLTTPWTGGVVGGVYRLRFSTGEIRYATLAAGKVGFTWSGALLFDASTALVVVSAGEITELLAGSMPYTLDSNGAAVRIPAVFFTIEGGTQPDNLEEETVYFIERLLPGNTFAVYEDLTGGNPIDISSGAAGQQYFNTFYPVGNDAGINGSTTLVQYSPQRVNLPAFEVAQCLVEVGNTVIIGGITNTLYPWNQIDATPSDLIALPESNVKTMINVNNMAYVFAGNKGNVYITNNSVASLVTKVPDYCAGIAGTPASYIEPYFTWGDAMYLRGRVYFSILDQTATKTGNCGGVWSFIPTQNFSYGQDIGVALRLENRNSYGTYNGMATVILAAEGQTAIAPQYWTGWQNSYTVGTSNAFGIDSTDTKPTSPVVIETDLLNSGTFLDKATFAQLEYKFATPLVSGDTVQLYYRLNATDAYTSCGTVIEETANPLSGYYDINFQKTQWVQIKAILTPNGLSTTSFVRLKEIRLR